MLELESRHTHLYPGAQGRVLSGDPLADGPVTVAFADGSRASGSLAGGRLSLAPYQTAAGASVRMRSWLLRFERTPAGVAFRVSGRASGAP